MASSLTLTDGLATALANAVASGVPIETAALAANVPPRTVYAWLEAAETGFWPSHTPVALDQSRNMLARFAQLITRAQAEWEAKQVQRIEAAAQEVNAKTGLHDWRAPAWLLEHHPRTRDRYRQANVMQVQDERAAHPAYREVQSWTDAELERVAQLELPAPTQADPRPSEGQTQGGAGRSVGWDERTRPRA